MSRAPAHPFDPGLQPERTLLAWRRTCLALAVGATVSVRFAGEVLGGLAVVLGAVGIVTAGLAYAVAARRYRAAHEALHAEGRLVVGGTALGLLTATVLLIGLAGAVYVVGGGR